MPDENTIIVCGVKNKHPNLQWKEIAPYPVLGAPKQKQKQKQNKEIETETEKRILSGKPDGSLFELPEPKKPKIKKEPSSDHTAFVEFFTTEYQNTFRTKYNFNGGKDAVLVQRLLKNFGLPKLKVMVQLFFSEPDKFSIDGGYGINIFNARAQGLSLRITKGDRPPEKALNELTPEELEERLNQ